MADETGNANTPTRARRSSFAGETFANLFGGNRQTQPKPIPENGGSNSPPAQYPGPISQAAAQANNRRLSLTTLGLSGSPNSTSPFNSYRGTRRESISSANSASIDENAIEDDAAAARDPNGSSQPTTPFARRMSFGARALRDVRSSNAGQGGGGTGQNGIQSPPATSANKSQQAGTSLTARDAKGRGSADFWNENMRTRAERTSSISGQGGMQPQPMHARAKSVATMEAPIKEMPAQPKQDRRPDHFQERILKGDFYMD